MYAVQKDVWHLTGLDKTIVEQLLRWSNNLFNVGTYESRQQSKVAIDSIIGRVGSGLLTNPLRIKLWVDSSPKVCP